MAGSGNASLAWTRNWAYRPANVLTDNYDFVILIDDLEHDHIHQAADVFQRYRSAFDTILTSAEHRARTSVHFLVNMLEAYFLLTPKL